MKTVTTTVHYTHDKNGAFVARYTYDEWGNITAITDGNGVDVSANLSHIANLNPLRYRSYFYDTETGFYWLNTRYYDPEIGRFINADSYASTGQGVLGHNMFAYCGNNAVDRADPSGQGWVTRIFKWFRELRKEWLAQQDALKNAPDLDVNTASPDKYNCYGNALKKQILANPTGYTPGDSARVTFTGVKLDLGEDNVRELNSIDDPIEDDEYKVALRCGPTDYHFIRLDGDQWYTKSGTLQGLYIDQSIVTERYWFCIFAKNGVAYIGDPQYGFPYYEDEIIYFAVKVG